MPHEPIDAMVIRNLRGRRSEMEMRTGGFQHNGGSAAQLGESSGRGGPVAKRGSVQDEVAGLDSGISATEHLLGSLYSRLDSAVLRATPPDNATANETADDYAGCTLAEQLRSLRRRVATMTRILTEIDRRLEL